MNIRIAEKIIITDCGQYLDEVVAYCKDKLVIPNPDFYKKQALGKWTGGTPSEIFLYEKNGSEFWLPFGCLGDVWKRWGVHGGVSTVVEFCSLRCFNYQSNIKPYAYQENAIQSILAKKNGILVAPCGSGKTQIGLETVARIGGKALWLTHTQDLLNQSKARAQAVFDCGGYGTITGGKVNIGNGLTFATIQTMAKLDLAKYKNCWDIIVVDECQHCAGTPTRVTQFYKVLSGLSARYKIGLTATPRRSDGLEQSMFALLGNVIYTIPKADVEDTTCSVKVEIIPTGYFPNCDAVLAGDGTINYSALVDDLTTDQNRFDSVLDRVIWCRNGRTIVLANRVEYLQRMCDAYNQSGLAGVCLSGMKQNKAEKKKRNDALSALERGEIDCIFATYQLAKEGLDVPHLDYVIFATPEKDETTVVQSAGRVARKADGKEYGTVIDFSDNFGMYHGWEKKRRGYYKKLGYEIFDKELTQYVNI